MPRRRRAAVATPPRRGSRENSDGRAQCAERGAAGKTICRCARQSAIEYSAEIARCAAAAQVLSSQQRQQQSMLRCLRSCPCRYAQKSALKRRTNIAARCVARARRRGAAKTPAQRASAAARSAGCARYVRLARRFTADVMARCAKRVDRVIPAANAWFSPLRRRRRQRHMRVCCCWQRLRAWGREVRDMAQSTRQKHTDADAESESGSMKARWRQTACYGSHMYTMGIPLTLHAERFVGNTGVVPPTDARPSATSVRTSRTERR